MSDSGLVSEIVEATCMTLNEIAQRSGVGLDRLDALAIEGTQLEQRELNSLADLLLKQADDLSVLARRVRRRTREAQERLTGRSILNDEEYAQARWLFDKTWVQGCFDLAWLWELDQLMSRATPAQIREIMHRDNSEVAKRVIGTFRHPGSDGSGRQQDTVIITGLPTEPSLPRVSYDDVSQGDEEV